MATGEYGADNAPNFLRRWCLGLLYISGGGGVGVVANGRRGQKFPFMPPSFIALVMPCFLIFTSVARTEDSMCFFTGC